MSSDPGAAVRLCERSLAAARRLGDLDLELCSLSGLGEKLVMAGEVEKGLSLVDEAMAGTLGGECSRLDSVVYISCDMLVACDLAADVERARQWCEVADRFIERYGCPFLYARCRTLYGSVLVATGHWDEGERELLRAIEMSEGGGPAVVADAYARLADLRLRQGRLDEASALLHGREEDVRACFAAATLRLAQGDPAAAVSLLRRRLTDSRTVTSHPDHCWRCSYASGWPRARLTRLTRPWDGSFASPTGIASPIPRRSPPRRRRTCPRRWAS